MDFVDARERKITFYKQNLWMPWPDKHWAYGYCCDVMEHIPPEKVDKVLANIMAHCGKTFFSISFQEDHFGRKVGHPLHLTVRPFEWWRDKLAEHGAVHQGRDLIGMGVFFVHA